MFTGIIQEVGKILYLKRVSHGAKLRVESFDIVNELTVGGSVAVNGSCLTATRIGKTWFEADLSRETLERTTFKSSRPGTLVNLELPVRAGDFLGGHIVTGHVDCTTRVLSVEKRGGSTVLRIRISDPVTFTAVPKGSISVNGVSLTISRITNRFFEIHVIPHTLKLTNLRFLKPGDMVNIEYDMLLKSQEPDKNRRR